MGFRLMPLCMPLAVISLAFASYTQTAEKKVMSVVLPVVDGAVGVVLCSLILIPLLKMNGLYISNILNGFICAAVIIAGAWLVLKRCPRSLEDLMAVPDRIGVSEKDRIDITVRNMEEVVDVSRQIIEFCRAKDFDRRRAYFAGLCMEEMAGNVILHGFPQDKKAHAANIRVAHKGNELILRIRDNCVAFDPSEYSSVLESEDKAKYVGIRLVYQVAGSVSYQNLLGMNVLTIRI